ncbi:LysR family transcriptional regulator [Rothia uropygialis]|uniref:LysR family transcriptional regulator n=1 Tax=Kocuria sp. 36 TaxID=1415402 RepID=UPI00101BF3E3|nr:LysR family transcriptional regulator [Kocuria sp. 36]
MRVFVAIFEARNLTTAAEHLHVTQSAVSQSLKRLRKLFEDVLFERIDRRMEPTPVAIDAYMDMREALDRVDATLNRIRRFNPTNSRKKFRLALSELGEVGWLGNIVAEVKKEAPHVNVQSVPLVQDQLGDWLQRGHVDVAIAPADIPGDFVRTSVKDQSYVVVMSPENPFSQQTLSLDEYRQSRRAFVSGDSAANQLAESERRSDAYAEPTVTVQRLTALPNVLISNPDLVALAPSSIAYGWRDRWNLWVSEAPFEIRPVRFHVCRRGTSQSTSALDWFYRTVARAVVATPAAFDAMGVTGAGQS